jgi:diguanylate cyclase (GGDEF)-like protein
MNKLILIIDDDESIASLERRHLEKDGFGVLAAGTGEEGLRIIGNGTSPDLLVIDYHLPDMSGVELMQRVRELGRNIPSLIVTGGADENVAVKAMKLGAMDYIVKDRDTIKHLPESCREVLEKFHLAEDNRKLIEELKRLNEELTDANTRLRELSKRDDLTGIYNRRYIMEVLNTEIARAERYRYHLSLAIFDLDNFKRINDTYGHSAGDAVLVQFANLLRGRLRKTDVAGRYGGEEFAVIFSGTPLDRAVSICDELNGLVAQTSFGEKNPGIRLTTSVGVAYFTEGMEKEVLIDTADKSLYMAKEAGKNCVRAIQDRRIF